MRRGGKCPTCGFRWSVAAARALATSDDDLWFCLGYLQWHPTTGPYFTEEAPVDVWPGLAHRPEPREPAGDPDVIWSYVDSLSVAPDRATIGTITATAWRLHPSEAGFLFGER